MAPLISVLIAIASTFLGLGIAIERGDLLKHAPWWLPILFFLLSAVVYALAIVLAIVHRREEKRKDASATAGAMEIRPKAEAAEIKIYLDELALGYRMWWMDNTFIFAHCRIISRERTTSILSITATLETSEGTLWQGNCLDNLSDWFLCYDKGPDVDMETESLLPKLKGTALVREVQQFGWIGIRVPFPPKPELLDFKKITMTVEDAKERKHTSSFGPPWPVNQGRIVVAKHVRKP